MGFRDIEPILREADFHILAIGFRSLEERVGLQPHEAGHKVGRDLGNANIESVGVPIEAAALGGDLLLEVGDAPLELHEVRVGFQVRIVFRTANKVLSAPETMPSA